MSEFDATRYAELLQKGFTNLTLQELMEMKNLQAAQQAQLEAQEEKMASQINIEHLADAEKIATAQLETISNMAPEDFQVQIMTAFGKAWSEYFGNPRKSRKTGTTTPRLNNEEREQVLSEGFIPPKPKGRKPTTAADTSDTI